MSRLGNVDVGIDFAQLRNLDTSNLSTAADTAVTLGKDLQGRAGDVTDLTNQSAGSGWWDGADAAAQNELLRGLAPPLEVAGDRFFSSAAALDTLITEVEGAKSDIERGISSYPELTVGTDGSISWPPSPNGEREAEYKRQAGELSRLFKAAVERANTADEASVNDLTELGDTNGIKLGNGQVLVATGDDDDEVTVSNDADGNVIVTVNGEEQKYDPGTKLILTTGDGADSVTIKPSVDNDVTVDTGDGDDSVVDNGLPGQEPSKGQRLILTGEGDDEVVMSGDNKHVFTEGGDDTVTAIGDKNYVSTGGGNDEVNTTGGVVDAGAGDDVVRAGNHENPFYKDAPEHSTAIHGGDGDDEIQGSNKDDVIFSGAGDDEIYGHDGNDRVSGDDGNDYIDGQDGDDSISGGDGDDTVYGLDGNDTISGDQGRDYLEGGADNDTISGDAGKDVVSGGRGDDRLRGGADDDVMYAGDGADDLDGQGGSDTNYVQDEDTVANDKSDTVEKVGIADNSFIQIDGSDEFQDRVRADLDMYSSSPAGRQMMENLADRVDETHNDGIFNPGEREIVIHEYDEENGSANKGMDASWSDANVNINPDFHLGDNNEGVPSAVLYHELAHTYDYLNGTLAPGDDPGGNASNRERAAVGLDNDWDGDGVRNDVHSSDNPHPYQYTENGLRDEMGIEHRYQY